MVFATNRKPCLPNVFTTPDWPRKEKKILERKEKTKKFELRRKQLEEEKYGKDGYLKKVIEKELELENNGKNNGESSCKYVC